MIYFRFAYFFTVVFFIIISYRHVLQLLFLETRQNIWNRKSSNDSFQLYLILCITLFTKQSFVKLTIQKIFSSSKSTNFFFYLYLSCKWPQNLRSHLPHWMITSIASRCVFHFFIPLILIRVMFSFLKNNCLSWFSVFL